MDEQENILQTAARELPIAKEMALITPGNEGPAAVVFAVPVGQRLETIELEKYRFNPTRADGTAKFSSVGSFLAYVDRHSIHFSTVVWADFDPRTYKLSFTAVFDDHSGTGAGWRKHRAVYTPAASVEWGIWSGANRKVQSQVDFALFIEDNAADINGMPSEADMLKMATEFEARQDMRLKSAVRLQSGGVRMEYVDTDDAATVQHMQLFDSFHIAIPVFFGADTAEKIKAKLRYRIQSGNVSFWYELQRPDKAHERAAHDMIERVREGIGGLPLLMGSL